MTLPLQDDHGRFVILGHRGSPRRFAENTRTSLEAALTEGADGFECDLRETADGSIVLLHDAELGRVKVASSSLADLRMLQPQILTHHELRAIVPAASIAVLEVKAATSLAWVASFSAQRVVLSSFDSSILGRIRDEAPLFDTGLVATAREVPGAAARAAALRARFLFPQVEGVERSLVEHCRDLGIAVIPWTANAASDWERLLACGCSGVITDVPAEAVEWRKSRVL